MTDTPHTACVQTFGNYSKLLRNSGFALAPNRLIYGACRLSMLNDCDAYKSARRSGPRLRFLNIEQRTPTAPDVQGGYNNGSPKKKRRRQTQRTSAREISFKTELKTTEKDRTDNKTPKTSEKTSSSKQEEESSITSENSAPSPKLFNQKKKTPTAIAKPTRKSIRNRQSTVAKAFGNPFPINTIDEIKQEGQKKNKFQHRIANRPDTDNLKTEPKKLNPGNGNF